MIDSLFYCGIFKHKDFVRAKEFFKGAKFR